MELKVTSAALQEVMGSELSSATLGEDSSNLGYTGDGARGCKGSWAGS